MVEKEFTYISQSLQNIGAKDDWLFPVTFPQMDFICISDNDVTVTPSHIEFPQSLPIQPYIFDPNIHKNSVFELPRNVIQTGLKDDGSAEYHMPHWQHKRFTSFQQKEFISKYFPERMTLYEKYVYSEAKTNLFIYLWLYLNGGIYIDSDYELKKPLDPILDGRTDLYFVHDDDRYISPKFLASRSFCDFWIEVVNLMEKRKNFRYSSAQEDIDRNTGRGLLTDIIQETYHKFTIIPRSQLYPYNNCDIQYDKDSYLAPSDKNKNIITYMSCWTGNSFELMYITGALIVVIVIMVIIALITN